MTMEEQITVIVTALVGLIGAVFVLTPGQQAAFIPALVAIIGAVIAFISQKKTATIINAYTAGTTESYTPAIIAKLPKQSWTMSDSTKRFITFECPADVKADILRQVDEAEALFMTDYTVNYPSGHYHIQYGLQYAATGNCGGK